MKKIIVLVITFLITTSFVISYFFVPKLSNYPDLNGCFETSVHKINLCRTNPSYSNLDNISKYFIHSTLISEDDSFYIHKGIDWNEFKNSFQKNIKLMRFARGGSTITQQLVKNAYLTQNKSIFRKIKEILLAQEVEDAYPKALILEKYLNVIELGQGIYGVKSASKAYFGKSPSELNLLEAIFLTTLLPNPKLYSQSISKGKLPSWQAQRIETLLYRLLKRQRISEDLYSVAKLNIDKFPWRGIDLTESKNVEGDNLDFLDEPANVDIEKSLDEKVKVYGEDPENSSEAPPETEEILEENDEPVQPNDSITEPDIDLNEGDPNEEL